MVIGLKILLGVCGLVMGLVLYLWRERIKPPAVKFDRVLMLAIILSRLGVFIGLFGIIHEPPHSDVTVYYREAKAVVAGQLPLVDVKTAYGPLFPYFAAGPVLLWDSAISIILLSVVIEILSLPLWMRVARAAFDEDTAERAGILYVSSPILLCNVPITGQNHIWLSLLLAMTCLYLIRRSDAVSGLWLGLSIVAVKFLSLIFAPVMFVASPNRVRWTGSFLLFPVLAYVGVIVLGADPLEQLRFHATYNSSGSVPYLLGTVGVTLEAPSQRIVANALGVLVLGAVFVAWVSRIGIRTPRHVVLLCALVLLIVLMVSKKSFASYLMICAFPLCLSIAENRRRVRSMTCFGLFGLLASVEPSLWFRWMHQGDLSLLWSDPSLSDVSRSTIVLFLLCEVALLGFYAVYGLQLWRQGQGSLAER